MRRNRWISVAGVVVLLSAALAAVGAADAAAATPAVFSVGDATVVEGDGVAVTRELKIPVTLSDPVAIQTKVSYQVTGGSAVAGSDFVAINGIKTLTFNALVVKKVIVVKVLPDLIPEATKTLTVTLSNPIGGPGLLRAGGTGTIVDDDPVAGLSVSVGDAAVVEGDSGGGVLGTVVQFPVTLSTKTPAAVWVKYATIAGSASSGVDFTPVPLKTLKFAANTYKKYLSVKVTRDSAGELDESFSLVLSVPVGVTITRSTGTATIIDDDPPGATVITGTSPSSPSSSATPTVIGTAEAGTTVNVYLNGSCSGSPAATSSAATFGGAGIPITVPVNTTTTITARSVDSLGLLSPCSASVSYVHTAAVVHTGLGWGRSDNGQVGDGTLAGNVLAPTTVLPGAVAVTTTLCSSAALKADGTLWTWGCNAFGALGDPTSLGRSTPVQVGSDSDWSEIAGGWNYVLALKTDGSLWAWGTNTFGQVGDGTNTDRLVPTHIGTDTWSAIAAGSHSAAIRSDGTLWTWGANNVGQLGDGTTTNRWAPVQVGSDSDWTTVDVSAHTLALRSNGSLWAFGWNFKGQLGDGTFTNALLPVQVGTDTDWASVDAGGSSSAAIKFDGTLWTWGDNSAGTLGVTGPALSQVPLQVGTDTDWDRVSLSTCGPNAPVLGIRASGTLWGWGSNAFGQLGVGSAYSVQATPTQVGSATDWTDVVAGCEHSLGVETT